MTLVAAARSAAAKRLEGITTTEALAGSAGPALAQRAAPQRAAPDSGAAGQNNPVTASRLTVGPDTYYEVGWADTLNGAYSYSLHLTGVSQYTLPTLVARDTYDWQAYTCTGGGCIASPVWSFTMAVPPPTAPQPSQPTDGATGVQNPVTLSWLAAGADSDYQVAYDDTTAGSGYTSPIDVGIQTSYAMPSLAAGHTFNWLAYGCTSFCVGGTISSFTMYAPQPGIPQLSAPANGVTNVGVTPTLSWFSAANAVAGVTYYQIGLWDGQTTAQIGGNLITTDPTTQVQAPAGQGLVLGRSYWWAVSACSPQLCTNWSSFWLFTTVPAPGAAAQQSPPNDATGVGTSPTLSWAAPTSYDYSGVRRTTTSSSTTRSPNTNCRPTMRARA